jgi:hypothetical protein
MLTRLGLICLLGMVFISVFEFEADAATCKAGYTYRCPTVGGTRCCGCWRTGSEICDAEIAGLGNITNCVPGVNCPVVTCSVYGTVDLGDGLCNPNTLDPDCGIEGIAFGLNLPPTESFGLNQADEPLTTQNQNRKSWSWPKHHKHPKPTPTPPPPTPTPTAVPIIVETSLTASADIEECDEDGVCRKSIEIDLGNCPDCSSTSEFQTETFSATEFNGEICVCPGGYSTQGVCCANTQRRIGGNCAKKGKEVCLAQRCTADLTGYLPGTDIPYVCTELRPECR